MTSLSKSLGEVSNVELPKFTISSKVLLVDDDEINQQIVGELLEQHNLRFIVANNGAEAIERLETQVFDLVLMDIEMPVLDGISTTQRIRQMAGEDSRFSYLRDLPIIAMTAHALTGDRARFLDNGLDDHLTKPIDPHALSLILKNWLPDNSLQMEYNQPEIDTGPEGRAHMGSTKLESLSGIDIAKGIARCGGNHQLYYKLLLNFANTYQHALNLQQSEQDVFASKCHSIKGSAGNLGLVMISQNASSLESKFKKEGVLTEMEISHFLQLLSIQCQQIIDEYDSDSASEGGFKQASEEKLKVLILSDDVGLLKPIVQFLTADYRVLVASEPQRALELLSKHHQQGNPIGAMIALPTSDDDAVFHIAKAYSELKVVMSGNVKDEVFLEKALAAGVNEFLPMQPAPLLVKLRLEQSH